MAAVTTPWGKATATERVSLPQRVGGKRFATVVELLESETGELLLRVAYTTDGRARRGPVTVRLQDLDRARAALEKAPRLRAVLTGEQPP